MKMKLDPTASHKIPQHQHIPSMQHGPVQRSESCVETGRRASIVGEG